ncbi:MAG: HAMP domain-containing histidine kinase [Oscillospiraceae bacterium]|nr:HAMP domain-containing histidine kinase [Oscillospiraceae bacterium]
MDQFTDALGLLDKITTPAFCVRNGMITNTNQAAAACMIEADTPIASILETGAEEYPQLNGGCLYLNLNIEGISLGASVVRMDDIHIFCVEQDADNRELQAMALASRELRKPLTSVMITAQKLFPMENADADPDVLDQITRLNRGLFQMLRVIENMSDANRYTAAGTTRQEVRDITAVIGEIFDKAATMVEHTGLTLEYKGYPEAILCLTDAEKLERAIFNIVSNAVKFTPAGGSIQAKLTRRDNKLYLTVTDSGSGIAEQLKGSIFSRYTRRPGLEDDRFGIGLGMVLIRSAAALHGGTVLVDHPRGKGTRITVSLAIRPGNPNQVSTPRQKIDYSGGWDHSLVELSDVLPTELYKPHK